MTKKNLIIIWFALLPMLSIAQVNWQNTLYNQNEQVNKLYCANNDSIFALTNGLGLFCSANSGNTWNDMNSGITTSKLFSMIKTSEGKFLVGSTGYTFFSSTDASNWTIGVMNGTGKSISDFDDPNTGVIYAGQIDDGIFRSYDNGTTWSEFGFCCDGVRCVYHSGDSILYAGTNAKGLYNTSNNGTTWKTINTGLKSKRINDLIFCNNVFYCATDSGLFSSTNFGAQWTPIAAMENKLITCLHADKYDNLFAGSETHGVFVLKHGFTYWTQENTGLSALGILSICSDSSNIIYVSTSDSSVFRSAQSFNSVNEPIAVENLNVLCYPNPASGQVNISFNLLNNSFTSIEILSAIGEKCVELFSGNLDIGTHQYLWNTDESGIYFCRITTNNSSSTQLITIIK